MAARNREAILRCLDAFIPGFLGKLAIMRGHGQNAVTKFSPPSAVRHLGDVFALTRTVSHTNIKLATLVVPTTNLLLLGLFLPACFLTQPGLQACPRLLLPARAKMAAHDRQMMMSSVLLYEC